MFTDLQIGPALVSGEGHLIWQDSRQSRAGKFPPRHPETRGDWRERAVPLPNSGAGLTRFSMFRAVPDSVGTMIIGALLDPAWQRGPHST